MLPFFLIFVFGLLQMGELGVATVVTNYAASSVARKAANEETFRASASATPAPVIRNYMQKVQNLMVVGMSVDDLFGCVMKDPNDPTAELGVTVRAKIQAWPFFSNIIDGALKGQYAPQALSCSDAGSFNFSAGPAPYYFYVTGKAKVRLNYVP